MKFKKDDKVVILKLDLMHNIYSVVGFDDGFYKVVDHDGNIGYLQESELRLVK